MTGFSRSVLVIGGGIAGIQTALDLANAGFKTILVERSPSIGGRMAQLDKTFPTLDCSACILTPKMADVPRNPNIILMTCTEVLSTERGAAIPGAAGAFHVTLERKPRYVDVNSCTACGACTEACPVVIPNSFNIGLNTHKAIYQPFPQAIPNAFAIQKKESPCRSACPAHIPVQGYVALIAQGKFKHALERVRQAGVPFVGTLGRVCYHPCESICKRSQWDEPVSVCALKRSAYDFGLNEDGVVRDEPQPIPVQWNEKIAVIGAGPAGLTAAYELACKGYHVTVFDELPVPGGMLAVGIPAFRLPRTILNQEIDFICKLGVELRLNTPVGRHGGPSIEDLRREYQAVFLAIGAHHSSQLGVPGEDLPEVLQAVTFLRQVNLGYMDEVLPSIQGKRVAVIGGGNTAVDAARSALRLGANVQILYRRTRVEMPAAKFEVDAAETEGIELKLLVAPLRVLEEHGHLVGMECIRMELGEPDASGRRRPVPIKGSEFKLGLDTVIAAIGQSVESEGLGLKTNRDRLVADPETMQTPLEGVFAGGDAVTGAATVVEAVGAGIRVAETIHRYLRGVDLRNGRKFSWPDPKKINIGVASNSRSMSRLQPAGLQATQARVPMPELEVAERVVDFREVELGLTREQAIKEAKRCLDCAICSDCNQCVTACQRGAIHHDEQLERIELDVSAIVVATGFDIFEPSRKPEFGYGVYPQVITTMEFERLASASGPTAGKISLNGKPPKKVVFIQCVGSRDRSLDIPYCSRVCCMVVAKQAHLAHERLPGAEITVFYMDVRAFGKGFEEFYDRVRQEGIIYRRGNPSEIIRCGERLVVRAEDTLLGELVEVEADLVVLAVGLQPRTDAGAIAQTLNLKQGTDGFFREDHPKLRTVESGIPGVFLAGCCQGPKDIPDTVAHAKAAASAAMILLAGIEMVKNES